MTIGYVDEDDDCDNGYLYFIFILLIYSRPNKVTPKKVIFYE